MVNTNNLGNSYTKKPVVTLKSNWQMELYLRQLEKVFLADVTLS